MMVSSFLSIAVLAGCAAAAKWSYPDYGNWEVDFKQCGGERQSPINIVSSQAKVNKQIGNLELFHYYSRPKQAWSVKNSGYSLVVSAVGGFEKGGNKYKFEQFHLHWGAGDNPGSEHLLNYKQYPAEIHFVHSRNDVKFSNASTWTDQGDSLSVLGIFIDVGPEENPAFEYIMEAAENIKDPNTVRNAPRFTLESFLPDLQTENLSFYRYNGSLTTPPCFEAVVWNVLHKPILISRSQLRKFQALNNPEQKPVHNNFRESQELLARDVFTSTPIQSTPCQMENSATSLSTISSLLIPLAVHSIRNLF